MKNKELYGHPLTEKEMCEVKGGMWYAIKVVTKPYEGPKTFPCEACGHDISDFIYNAHTDTYTSVCFNCGCRKEVKMEE